MTNHTHIYIYIYCKGPSYWSFKCDRFWGSQTSPIYVAVPRRHQTCGHMLSRCIAFFFWTFHMQGCCQVARQWDKTPLDRFDPLPLTNFLIWTASGTHTINVGKPLIPLFVAGAVFGEPLVPVFVVGAVFGKPLNAFLVAGAVFGESPVPLFVVSAVFGKSLIPFFVAGAVFGEPLVPVFVAGAAFGEPLVRVFVAGVGQTPKS